ncbi:hypothetical protein G6F68_012697 [Rhizopus microsporus]|nr:hypothetical protein G6F68_012697 [Rhizopus microsporus]
MRLAYMPPSAPTSNAKAGAAAGLQLVGPDAGVDLQGARDDVGVIGAAGIQAGATDTNAASFHAIALQHAIADDRRAGGQSDTAGVEEAGTIDLDAGRIGDDHLRPGPGHLHIAVEVAGIAAVDLVEDDACGAGRQPRIALNPAAELGLHVAARVVEDDTLLANVELLVGIARHPARTGRGDVHLGRAIGRSDHGRALVGRCARVGGNPARVSWRLLCGQRLHQSHPAQHQPQREADRLQGTDRPAAATRR